MIIDVSGMLDDIPVTKELLFRILSNYRDTPEARNAAFAEIDEKMEFGFIDGNPPTEPRDPRKRSNGTWKPLRPSTQPKPTHNDAIVDIAWDENKIKVDENLSPVFLSRGVVTEVFSSRKKNGKFIHQNPSRQSQLGHALSNKIQKRFIDMILAKVERLEKPTFKKLVLRTSEGDKGSNFRRENGLLLN